MVKCEYEHCIHNDKKICKLDILKIDSRCYCDSCEFADNPNNLFEGIREKQKYLKRKNTFIL